MTAGNDQRATASTIAGFPPPQRLAFARGYREVAEGKPFSTVYVGPCADLQLLYEYGRLEATNVRAAGLPVLRDDGSREAALRIAADIKHAKEAAGPAIPPDHQGKLR